MKDYVIERVPDDHIVQRGENDHAIYIVIGTRTPTTVTWMPGYERYWCATCNKNECAHTKRVKKWREARAA